MDYEKLYATCVCRVYSYVMTLCHDQALAEEITQNTFLRAVNADAGKQAFAGRSEELTWLCAIAKNLYADEMRRRVRLAEMPPDVASADDIASDVADEDMSFRIHKVLHTLEEPYKEVFGLRVFGELPFAKIGELFGKTENWARVTYHRARLKIQERMEADGKDL